jgi:hypothetical protein
MRLQSVTLVGGTFDAAGGRPSGVVRRIARVLKARVGELTYINGGNILDLKDYICRSQALIWMPNIDNAEDKIISSLKANQPHLLLVSSKRVIEKDYRTADVVGRLLKTKSNLGIVISANSGVYNFQIMDPLGNQFASSTDINLVAEELFNRMSFIFALTRKPSVMVGDSTPSEIDPDFIKIVQDFGARFSTYVNAVNPNRLLGNASTRCSFGFPGARTGTSYFISERNVNKSHITSENFVRVGTSEDKVEYSGPKKPSVDAPIQIKVFNYFKNVNYIIHGHVYVCGAPFTRHKLPCGAVEEIDELKMLLSPDMANACINLRGHGCLILANDLRYFDSIELAARVCPEF